MRILVYGGRKFTDRERLYRHLDRILDEEKRQNDTLIIIQGVAPGADMAGRDWAISREVSFEDYPARWDDLTAANCRIAYSRRTGMPYNVLAGFNRNQQMVDEGKPDMAVECPGESGTADMRKRLMKAKIGIFLLR